MYQWIPGHSRILGNHAADREPARGHLLGAIEQVPFTKAEARSFVRLLGKEEFLEMWLSPEYPYKPYGMRSIHS